MPWLQRAYAWRQEHCVRLVEDLINAFQANEQYYFIGFTSIAAKPDAEEAELVDGQQRLITLTILLALLRDRIDDPAIKSMVDANIWPPGNRRRNPRLVLQPHVHDFFLKSVQMQGATTDIADDPEAPRPEGQKNLAINLMTMAALIDERLANQAEKIAFAKFLLERCGVVVQRVSDPDLAWQLLAVEEETGLGFHNVERLKVTLISALPFERQTEAAQVWSHWQNRIGAARMERLLHHMRVVAIGKAWNRRHAAPIDSELLKAYDKKSGGIPTLTSDIAVHATNLEMIDKRHFPGAAEPESIVRSTTLLGWLPFDCWLQPALRWLQKHGPAHRAAASFFRALDRLSWIVVIGGLDPSRRDRLMAQLVVEVGRHDRISAIDSLIVPADLQRAAIANLRSRTFFQKRYSGLVLRRLSPSLSRLPLEELEKVDVTCEHVLPRNPKVGSGWRETFDSAGGVDQFTDRLGNLVLLTVEDNNLASTREWREKRPILRKSNFQLAKDAARVARWTPDVVQDRTEALISVLFRDWELPTKA